MEVLGESCNMVLDEKNQYLCLEKKNIYWYTEYAE